MLSFFEFRTEKTANRIRLLPIALLDGAGRSGTDEDALQFLTESIQTNGVLQPLLVRQAGSRYEVISGQRRMAAANAAGLRELPCIVLEVGRQTAAILSFTEHLQHQPLHFLEEAEALNALLKETGFSLTQAAAAVGIPLDLLQDKLRLLELSESQRALLRRFELSEAHARVLLRIPAAKRRMLLERTIKYQLNPERMEQLALEEEARRKDRESLQVRKQCFQNPRLFINTIDRAIETMEAAGIGVSAQKTESESTVQFCIRIPMDSLSDGCST